MRSPRLTAGFAVVLAFAGVLALLHGCQETPKPTEPTAAAAAVLKTLTIQASSGGDGVVTSSPAGINCTITGGVPAATGCKAQFQSTVVVILTAVAKAGNAFKEWFGDCHGSGTCQVPMTADHTVGARFFKGPFLIKEASNP